MKRKERFMPSGLLAVDPKAFGMLFYVHEPPENETRDGVAVITIRGPLMHHPNWCCDSYDGIRERVAAALEGSPRAIMLKIDSPGGVVAGCFDTVREIRRMVADAGVELYAYVDGHATSAAYALACAADTIAVPESACLGSIGVIDALVDATAQDAMFGLNFRLVASGARKTDGNPHQPIDDAAVAAAQKRVTGLAELFFELVAQARGIGVDDVRALEAGLVYGAEAVELGLADQVMSFNEMFAVASGVEEIEMSTKATSQYDDAIAKLRQIAEGDDEEEAKKAKRMLAAMDDVDEDDEDDDNDDQAEGEEEKPEAEGDDEEKKDEPPSTKSQDEDEDDAGATALRALREVHAMRAQIAKEKEDAERKELLASRPDFAPDVVKFLSKASIDQVREAVKTFPRGPVRIPQNPAAATAVVSGTRGEGEGAGSAAGLPPEEADALAMEMGIKNDVTKKVRRDGTRLVLGVMTPADARAYEAERAKRNQGASTR